jgi:DNA-binding transcriptional regulator YdaS (Cro superfamily)
MKSAKRGRKRINPMHPAVRRAMLRNGGTLQKLADQLHISPQALAQWRQRIPIKHVRAIEQLSGIPREKLRPDIYR